MNDVKITEIDSGVRALTDTELTMVAGGGNGNTWGSANMWWNVAKTVAIGAGSALGGPLGAVLGGLSVVFTQSCLYTGDGPPDACNCTFGRRASPGAAPM